MRTSFLRRRSPRGFNGLTKTDWEVLNAAAAGFGASQTAKHMGVTILWVKKVRRRIRYELGFAKGTPIDQAVQYARNHGFIQ